MIIVEPVVRLRVQPLPNFGSRSTLAAGDTTGDPGPLSARQSAWQDSGLRIQEAFHRPVSYPLRDEIDRSVPRAFGQLQVGLRTPIYLAIHSHGEGRQMAEIGETELTNVEIFNLVVAVIFGRLYNTFPVPARLNYKSLTEEVLGASRYFEPHHLAGIDRIHEDARQETKEGRQYSLVALHTISWLEQCSFVIRLPDSGTNTDMYVLSPKGFEVLAAVPASVTVAAEPTSVSVRKKGSFGKQLAAIATSAGGQISNAAVSDIVAQVIGAAGRYFTS